MEQMRKKLKMSMRYSLPGSAGVLLVLTACIFVLTGCCNGRKSVGYDYEFRYVYMNNTSVPVKLECHFPENNVGWPVFREVNIPAGKTYTDVVGENVYEHVLVSSSASVRVVFGQSKEIWFHRDGDEEDNIIAIKNYAEEADFPTFTYTYVITEEMYQAADDIEE